MDHFLCYRQVEELDPTDAERQAWLDNDPCYQEWLDARVAEAALDERRCLV